AGSCVRALVFQLQGERPQPPFVTTRPTTLFPRHIVIVSLETAPRKFYPIADDPILPVFHVMSQHALVSDRHYASAPTTALAIYSLMTGTYPRPGEAISRYGPFETDGLPTVLARHGYESTFIDSYDLSWNGQQRD